MCLEPPVGQRKQQTWKQAAGSSEGPKITSRVPASSISRLVRNEQAVQTWLLVESPLRLGQAVKTCTFHGQYYLIMLDGETAAPLLTYNLQQREGRHGGGKKRKEKRTGLYYKQLS